MVRVNRHHLRSALPRRIAVLVAAAAFMWGSAAVSAIAAGPAQATFASP